MCAPATGAWAGTHSKNYQANVSAADAPYQTMVQLPQFDTSLGTLTDVEITILNSLDADDVVSNVTYNTGEGTPYGFTNATTAASLQVTGPDGSRGSATATAVLGSGIAGAKDSEYAELLASAEDSFFVPSENFDVYQGSDSTLLDFIFAPQTPTFSGDTTAPANTLTFGGTAAIAGSVSVNYTYSSAAPAVSEPGSLVILGVGLLGIAAVSRRYDSL